ncbi:hypothetical protein OIU78_022941, partial [Salix suchowensis]
MSWYNMILTRFQLWYLFIQVTMIIPSLMGPFE